MKNNEIIASAGGNEDDNDYSIKIWSLINNNIIAVLGGHALPVYSLQVCENQKLLFSLSKDSTLRVWNLEKIYILGTEKIKSEEINKMCLFYSNTISKVKHITAKNSKLYVVSLIGLQSSKSLRNYFEKVFKSIKSPYETSRLIFNHYKDKASSSSFTTFLISDKSDIIIIQYSNFIEFYNFSLEKISKPIEKVPFLKSANPLLKHSSETVVFLHDSQFLYNIDIQTRNVSYQIIPGSNFKLINMFVIKNSCLTSYFYSENNSEYAFSIFNLKKNQFLGFYKTGLARFSKFDADIDNDLFVISLYDGTINIYKPSIHHLIISIRSYYDTIYSFVSPGALLYISVDAKKNRCLMLESKKCKKVWRSEYLIFFVGLKYRVFRLKGIKRQIEIN